MNDVLKKFTIVFGVDTKPLEQGIKKSESTLLKFGKAFNAIASTYFSYKIMQGVIQGYADFNSKLGLSTSLMNYNVENVSALGGALKRFGGDTQSVINSLDSLNNSLQEAKFGGGALIEVARKYGIAFQNSNGKLMSAEQLLNSLGNQLQRYDRQTRVAIARQLGLDDSLVRAFSNGSAELQRLIQKQKEYGVITQKDIRISDNFNNAILDLKDSFGGIIKTLARFVLPLVTKLLKLVTQFIEFLKKHKQFIIAFFSALLIAMTPILAMFAKMAVASAVAFAPIFAAIGVVTAIALVVEDIYYYFMGWDSVTGELVKKFPLLGKALEGIRPIFNFIRQTFSDIYDFLTNPTWQSFNQIFVNIGNTIKNAIEAPLMRVKNALSGIFDTFKGFFTDNALVKALGFSSDNAPAVIPNTNNAITNNVNANITQNVSTASPKALADNTANLLASQINAQTQQIGGR